MLKLSLVIVSHIFQLTTHKGLSWSYHSIPHEIPINTNGKKHHNPPQQCRAPHTLALVTTGEPPIIRNASNRTHHMQKNKKVTQRWVAPPRHKNKQSECTMKDSVNPRAKTERHQAYHLEDWFWKQVVVSYDVILLRQRKSLGNVKSRTEISQVSKQNVESQ